MWRDHPARMLWALGGLSLLCVALFLTLGARGDWGFVLPFRGMKVLAFLLVGVSVAVSTVLFQTVVGNRVLTPALMGFEALYRLIQTALIFLLGSAVVAGWDGWVRFLLEVGVMSAFSLVLFHWLFQGGKRSLHLLMLVGIVLGMLFRGISVFLQRIIDPNEFLVAQDRLFASFNRPDPQLILLSGGLILAVAVLAVRWRRLFDVLGLGREAAINLGLDYNRAVTGVLLIVSVLVSVSTALVGPLTFLGLLVSNLTYLLLPTHRHALLLPAASLMAVITLAGGQLILERLLGFDTALGIVIEFVGGLLFLFLLVRGLAR